MNKVLRSTVTAVLIAAGVQLFTVGVLSRYVPRELFLLCRPAAHETRRIQLESAPRLLITNEDGAVRVNAQRDTNVTIVADIRAYTPSGESEAVARQYLKSLLKVERAPGRLAVETEPAERPEAVDLQVDYEVTVPYGTDVVIHGYNGNVAVGPGCGRVAIRGNNTDIEVLEPRGSVDVESTNGRIRLYDSPADATLNTVNGSIYAHVRGGVLHASTTNGHIVATLQEPDVQACDLSATNGGITVALTEQCSARVRAITGHGIVRSDFPLRDAGSVQKRRMLQGTIGAGQTRLVMNALNGNIWITRRSL